MSGVKTYFFKVWLDSDLEAHLLQQTRKRQLRRASRGSRPVLVVALEPDSPVMPIVVVSPVMPVVLVSPLETFYSGITS